MLITFNNIQHDSAIIDDLYPYLTELHFKNNNTVKGVIDNVYSKSICIYLMDPSLSSNHFDVIYEAVNQWYENGCCKPISVSFEIAGIKDYVAPLCKSYNISNIIEINGPVYSFYDKPALIKKQQIRVEK